MSKGLVIAGAACVALTMLHSAAHALEPNDPESLDDCEGRVRVAPADYLSYRCYWRFGQKTGRLDEAASRLARVLERQPDNAYAAAFLARIDANRGSLGSADRFFKQAAQGYAVAGNHVAEAFLRLDYSGLLSDQLGRINDAEEQLERVAALVDLHPNLPPLLALRQTTVAAHRQEYGRALHLLRELGSELGAESHYVLRQLWLGRLAQTEWALGRLGSAERAYRAEAELMHSSVTPHQEAIPRRNLTFLAMVAGEERGRCRKLGERALDVAIRGTNRAVESLARADLSLLAEGSERVDLARQSLEIAEAVGHHPARLHALRALASALRDTHPPEALAAADRCIGIAEQGRDLAQLVRCRATRASVMRRLGPYETALEDGLATLDVAEAARSLQVDPEIRARYFGTWANAYYDLAAYLAGRLEGSDQPSQERLGRALEVMERMRARSLLDELEAARASTAPPSSERLLERRRELALEISIAQRQLLDPGTPSGERTHLERALLDLEGEEARLRAELAASDPAFAAAARPALASLADIQDTLADDQAMLLFHLGTRDIRAESDPWLLAVSRSRVTVHALPSLADLEARVDLLLGLLERGDGAESGATARLYDDLVAEALETLGSQIRSLVLVPDRVLHLLPFEVLRPASDATPLGTRYALSISPSATIWHFLKRSGHRPPSRRAVVVANPALDNAGAARTGARSMSLQAGPLGPLPFAEREADSVRRRLGNSRLLIGESATEGAFKELDLTAIGVLHFATHALVDLEDPQRTGVLLTPGAEVEDGVLQVRELVELDLAGQLVFLSACRTAGGPVLIGEGPMNLARPLLLAGASTVVGSLWPLDDQAAATLADRFYRHLGSGWSVARSMALARQDLVEAGAPARTWAGLVVLGDGDRALEAPLVVGSGWLWLAVLATLALAAGFAFAGGLPTKARAKLLSK